MADDCSTTPAPPVTSEVNSSSTKQQQQGSGEEEREAENSADCQFQPYVTLRRVAGERIRLLSPSPAAAAAEDSGSINGGGKDKEEDEAATTTDQRQLQRAKSIFVPYEEIVQHAFFVTSGGRDELPSSPSQQHHQEDGNLVTQEEIVGFRALLNAAQACDNYLNESSYQLIYDEFVNNSNRYLLFSIPTATFLKDVFKNIIEAFRMNNKRLNFLINHKLDEVDDSCNGSLTSLAWLYGTPAQLTEMAIKVHKENTEESIKICKRWLEFNLKLLEKAIEFYCELFANESNTKTSNKIYLTLEMSISSFSRNIADIYRYLYEFTELKEDGYLKKSEYHYKASIEASQFSSKSTLNQYYLSSVLNYCVCLYDCMDKPTEAMELLKNIYISGVNEKENLKSQDFTHPEMESINVLFKIIDHNHLTWTREQNCDQNCMDLRDNDSETESENSFEKD